MLEGLFNQLAKKSPPPAMAVPPVPSEKIETKSKNEKVALSACDRQKLLAYLDVFGETDQDTINEYLTECGKDAVILARALQHADDCLRVIELPPMAEIALQNADDCLQLKTGNTTSLIQCSGCRQILAGSRLARRGR